MEIKREKKTVMSVVPTEDELAVFRACSNLLYGIYREREWYSVSGKETDKELVFELEDEYGNVVHEIPIEKLQTAYNTVFYLAFYCHKIVFPSEFAKRDEVSTEEESENEN